MTAVGTSGHRLRSWAVAVVVLLSTLIGGLLSTSMVWPGSQAVCADVAVTVAVNPDHTPTADLLDYRITAGHSHGPPASINDSAPNGHTYYVMAGTTPVLVHNDGGYATPGNGTFLTVDETLEAGLKWLGDGYTEPVPGSGRYVSRDGTRVFRMGDSDIQGRHGGGPHTNFERMELDPNTGKMKVVQDDHVYFQGGAC